MDGDSIFSAIIILALLFCAAYFAVCETSFASVNRIRLKNAAERGDRRAKTAVYITEHFDKAITTILVGTNIVHLSAASYVTVLVTRRWGVSAVTLSTFITTLVVFFVGEMLPKSIAKKYSERISLATASSLRFFMTVFTPVSAILTAIGSAAAKLTKGDPEVTVTEEELYDIIESMTDGGELDAEQGELVSSALSFADVTVESILTARVDVVAFDVETPPERIMERIRTLRHSRVPVYEGSIDNIVGILHLNRFFKALSEQKRPPLRSMIMKPCFVYKTTKLPAVLEQLRRCKQHLAVVTDEYGGVCGIVTMEDVLEQIVGEIWDETDEVEEEVVERSDGVWELDGDMSIGDFTELLGLNEDEFETESSTVGGWTLEMFGSFPAEGDSFRWEQLTVTVLKMDGLRVERVLVRREEQPAEDGKDK